METDQLPEYLRPIPEKIAVFRVGREEDLWVALPALQILRSTFPNAHIALIGSGEVKQNQYREFVDECIAFPDSIPLAEAAANPELLLVFCRQMQQRDWDLLLQMQDDGTFLNPLLQQMGASLLAGLIPEAYRESPEVNERFFMAYAPEKPVLNRFPDLMHYLGFASSVPSLPLTFLAEASAQESLVPPKSFVGLCPVTRTARSWPASHYAWVASKLAGKGYPIIWMGTAAEREALEEIKAHLPHGNTSIFCGKNSKSLAWLLSQATLIISNDIQIAQWAVALKVPVVRIETNQLLDEQRLPAGTKYHRIREKEAVNLNTVLDRALDLLAAESESSSEDLVSLEDQAQS